jgi:crotonobetainyl-CoA:carnitine CoA-transferase CaiB-like acyl-CoA transferase
MAGLSGVRVVDLGHRIAGPLAALLLADAGADVVRVDSPEQADRPGPADAWLQRGKRRLTLDLTLERDRRTARELVAQADVVVDDRRLGALDRFGLGAAELCAGDPRLVHCALPGFAEDDPLAEVPASEGVLHAAVAGYRPLSQHWDPSGRRRARVADPDAPLFTPITTASNFGGLLGAVSVVMALLARARSGRGQRVEIPLTEAFAEAYSTMLGMRVYENGLMGDGQMLRDLTYRTADDGLVDLSPHAKFVIRLLTAAGVAGDWAAEGLIDPVAETFSLPDRDEIMARFAALVRTRTAAEWDAVATAAEVPVARVRTPAEWMASEHALRSGAAVDLNDPLAGPVRLPGRGFDLGDPLPPLAPRQVPDGGRSAVLAELRLPRHPAPHLQGPDLPPLAGIRVVDVSQAVAGPTAARLLADFGADVVKVGSAVPAVTDGIVGQLHRGKRTMLVDGRTAAGRSLTGDLVDGSDVLVTNFTWRSQARYAIDAPTLRTRNPRLVHCAVTAYGRSGPWANRRGYENQGNAASGMSHRYGARFGWTLYQPTPINDAGTGILGAFAVAVALYARGRTGVGQAVGASLVQASTLHQGVHLAAEACGRGLDERRSEHGPSPLSRLYRGADGWFYLAARSPQLGALLEVTGAMPAGGGLDDPAGELAQGLAARFAGEPVAHWTAALGRAGIAAARVVDIDEAVAYLRGRGVVYVEPGPDGRETARPGVGRWLSATPPRVGANPGVIGTQVVEILTEHGLSAAEIDDLAAAGVVRLPDGLPEVVRLT